MDGSDLERLWLVLARTEWSSLVIVPADPDGSSAALAAALAEAGTRLSGEPVSALALEGEQDARVLADVQRSLRAGRERARQRARAAADPHAPRRDGGGGRTILSIAAVARAPLGAVVAQAADAVLVTVALKRTRLDEVRRTVEMVGSDRVLGCCLV